MVRRARAGGGKTSRKQETPKKPSRKPAKRRRRTFQWPQAFRIVPVRLKTRPRRHAHVFGQAGVPPCPAGCVYVTSVKVGPFTYCVYVDEEGLTFMIRC